MLHRRARWQPPYKIRLVQWSSLTKYLILYERSVRHNAKWILLVDFQTLPALIQLADIFSRKFYKKYYLLNCSPVNNSRFFIAANNGSSR